MDTAEYLHERDIYYVVNTLHRTSMLPSRTISHRYNLQEHRMIKAPVFSSQRGILKYLEDYGVIAIEDCLDKKGSSTIFKKAITYTYRIANNDLLRKYHGRLMLKLEEAHLNHQALNEMGTLLLDIDGEYIYVIFPYHRLRINRIALRPNQTPQHFFEYLIENANGSIVTRDTFPFKMSRSFEDLAIKAGFDGKIRKMFVPILTKDKIQLLTEVVMSTKDSTEVYNQLMRDEYNHQTYTKYMEGIE